MQRGKRCQGSSEEVEEEEEEEGEDDGSMLPILWDELAIGHEHLPSSQVGPFPSHVARQEGEGRPSEPVETNHPTAFGPSMVASEPVEPGHLTSFGPLTVALESAGVAILIRPSPSS